MTVTLTTPYKQNTVVLKGRGYHEDGPSSDATAINPGMLLQRQTDGTVQHHGAVGGTSKLFAKEDALQGNWLNNTYASGDLVSYYDALPGDHVLGLLSAKCPSIAGPGVPLYSYGDGTLSSNAALNASVLYSEVAASTAISNTNTETKFDKNYTIPANTLQVGDVLKIHFEGIQTAQNSTNTLALKVYIGGLSGTALVTIAAATGAANNIFAGDIELTVRTIGATGTFVADASYTATPAASGTATRVQTVVASTTIDTTATQEIDVSATWSVANAGNSVRLDQLVVELVRGTSNKVVAFSNNGSALDNSAGTSPIYCPIIVA